MASVKFLRDKPFSERRVILRWETVQYARQINWRWFRWRKNTGVVPGGGATMGPEATVCNSSANETEGVRGRDLRVVTTGIESPVGAERA